MSSALTPDLDTLNHFVGQQAIQGKLGTNTAQSYFSSIGRIFEVATDVEKANVLNVDLESLFARFRQKNPLNASTLASYEGRVRAAISSFANFVKTGEEPGEPIVRATSMGVLSIPLRDGSVRIEGLPADLTAAEAKRIGAMVAAMVAD